MAQEGQIARFEVRYATRPAVTMEVEFAGRYSTETLVSALTRAREWEDDPITVVTLITIEIETPWEG